MRQFNVVMLPTEKASKLYIPNTGQLELGFNIQRTLPDVSQHLYITEPDAIIKEGDCCIDGGEVFSPYETGDIAVDRFEKIIATTDPELGLPLCKGDFIQAFVKYGKDLVITNVEVNKHNKTCYVSWVYRPNKVTYQNVDLLSKLVKSVQSSEEQVIPTTPLPKTQQEFIELLNQQVEGWVFTGSNPFTEANLRNHRLYDALQRMVVELFGSDDLGALEDLWERLVFETKPNYNGVKIDFIWLCECAKQYTPNEKLELLNERINSLKQFFNDPEIGSIINR